MSAKRLHADRCVIGLWRGYVKAQFYVPRPDSGDAFPATRRCSRAWRAPWRKSIEIRDDPAALKALAALEEDLWEQGWERTRRAPGAEWYELRFRPATSASRPPAASHLRQVTRGPTMQTKSTRAFECLPGHWSGLRRGRSAGSAVSASRSDPPRSTTGRCRRTSSVRSAGTCGMKPKPPERLGGVERSRPGAARHDPRRGPRDGGRDPRRHGVHPARGRRAIHRGGGGDAPELAAQLRIEERELEAGGTSREST